MNRYLIIFVAVIALSGCVTIPQLEYDDKAIEKTGTIVKKRELMNHQPFERDMIFVPAGGLVVPVFIGEPSRDGSDYIYEIHTTDDIHIEVLNKFSGFEVGQCVKLYLSKEIAPRISNGSGCIGDSSLDRSP
ncbi:MAG: lipoprotein [Candidatus Thiodiazotropha sp.]